MRYITKINNMNIKHNKNFDFCNISATINAAVLFYFLKLQKFSRNFLPFSSITN